MIHLIFDTETTGLTLHPRAKDEFQPRIIEWGGLLVDERGNELKELDVLINPGKPIPEHITSITGITDADVANQPPFSVAAQMLKPLFAAADVLVAHRRLALAKAQCVHRSRTRGRMGLSPKAHRIV